MSISRFVAPKPEMVTKRQVELEFSSNVGAGAYVTIVAGPIMYPYRILQAVMTFDQLANYNLQYRWFIGTNESAPTTGPPGDTNIFGRENPTAFFVGSGLIKRKNCDVEVREQKSYLKLNIYNGNNYAVYGVGSLLIQEI